MGDGLLIRSPSRAVSRLPAHSPASGVVAPPLPGLALTFDYLASRDGLVLRTGGPTQAGYAGGAGTWTPRLNSFTNAKGSSGDTNGEYQWFADPAYAWANGFTPFAIVDGKLRIRAQTLAAAGFTDNGEIPDRPTTTDPYPYVSGILNTKHSFSQQGGYFECRCKFTSGKATWPAFWMLPANGGWPPEIDPMEINGSNLEVWTGNAHSSNPTLSSPQSFDFNEEVGAVYRTYAIDWTDDEITWYIDGVEVASTDVSDRPSLQAAMYVILQMAIGSNIGSWVQPPDGTTPNPADLEVDYVRVWQRRGPNSLSLSATSILDNAVVGAVVGTLSATAYGGDEAFTYSIVSDPDSKFTIVGAQLRLAATVSFVADDEHEVRVRVTDAGARSWDKLFVIQVLEAEPSGTNLYEFTDDFSNAAWGKVNTTISAAGTEGQSVLETAVTDNHAVQQNETKAASPVNYQMRADLEGGLGRNWVKFGIFDPTFANGVIANFNIATGALGSCYSYGPGGFSLIGTPSITLLPNGKYRCVMGAAVSSVTQIYTYMYSASADDTTSFAGDITKGFKATNCYLFALP